MENEKQTAWGAECASCDDENQCDPEQHYINCCAVGNHAYSTTECPVCKHESCYNCHNSCDQRGNEWWECNKCGTTVYFDGFVAKKACKFSFIGFHPKNDNIRIFENGDGTRIEGHFPDQGQNREPSLFTYLDTGVLALGKAKVVKLYNKAEDRMEHVVYGRLVNTSWYDPTLEHFAFAGYEHHDDQGLKALVFKSEQDVTVHGELGIIDMDNPATW